MTSCTNGTTRKLGPPIYFSYTHANHTEAHTPHTYCSVQVSPILVSVRLAQPAPDARDCLSCTTKTRHDVATVTSCAVPVFALESPSDTPGM